MIAARLRLSASEPGLILSALAHAGLLAATLVAFSQTRPFDPAQEAVPIELVTASELNEITKGDKTAKVVQPKPDIRADRFAEVEEKKPTPPTPEAKRDVPTPPPPLKRAADPGEDDDTPPKPAPPQRVAVLPPPRPEPEKVEPKPEPKPEPRAEPKKEPEPKKEAEPAPVPPKRPAPEKPEKKEAEAKPTPPQPPKKVEEKKAEEKPKLDQVAKLLEQKKAEEKAKPVAKPKSGDEENPDKRKFDAADISKLLSREKPQSTGQAARDPARTASLGAPTANAQKMSPSLWGQLDAMLQEQFRRCWNNNATGPDTGYIPQIRVTYNADGSLASQPVLVNPTSNPMQRSVAESAMRAVRICNPLRIPEKYAPYYHEWRARTLRFDPNDMT